MRERRGSRRRAYWTGRKGGKGGMVQLRESRVDAEEEEKGREQ